MDRAAYWLQVIDWAALKRFFHFYCSIDFFIRKYKTAEALVGDRDQVRLAQAYLIAFVFVTESCRTLLFYLFPLQDPYWQVFLYEFYIVTDIGPVFKLLAVVAILVAAYIMYVDYFGLFHNKINEEIFKVLFEPEKTIISCYIPQILRWTIFVYNSIHFFTFACGCWTLVTASIFASAMSTYFQPFEWLSLLAIPIFTFNFCLSTVCICLTVYSLKIAATEVVMINLVMFTSFNVVNRMLPPCREKHYLVPRLRRFLSHHTCLVGVVFDLNRVYGHLLLVFMVFNVPINMVIVGTIMLGMVKPFIRVIFSILCFGYICCFVILHWMTTLYTHEIHRPYRVVVSLFVRFKVCSLRIRWKVASKIEAFITRKPYGITYGSFGLICINTFFKFLLLYGKFLMITYKNFRKVKNSVSSFS